MTFTEGGSFDGGRVQTGGGGRGLAIGGGGGLVLVIGAFLLNQLTGINVLPFLDGSGSAGSETSGVVGECTRAQANTDRACRLAGTTYSLDAYWAQALPAAGLPFEQPGVTAFQDAVNTGCGQASSSTGPFYCPPDRTIYMDLTFFDLLQSEYGASGGSLAEMYVTAHEYGHHVQQLTGAMDQADRQGTGAESDSVRIELQADCYAGLWAAHAASVPDPQTGEMFLEPLTDSQVADALSAAEAVGDDHIQHQAGGTISPDSWTHGSSEQRQRWFATGYTSATYSSCDTFAAEAL